MKNSSSKKKEIGIPPHGLSAAVKAKADEELRLLRFKRLGELDDHKRLYATFF